MEFIRKKFGLTTVHILFYVYFMKGPEEMLKIIKDLQSKEENEKEKCIADKEWTVSRLLKFFIDGRSVGQVRFKICKSSN